MRYIPARLVDNITQELDPGVFKYYSYREPEDKAGLNYRCPCGCGSVGALIFRKLDEHPTWEWDGNVEKPTLSPSIQRNVGCKTHCHLIAGVWQIDKINDESV